MSDYLVPLVNPDPQSVRGKEPLTALVERLEALPSEKLRILGQILVREHYPDSAKLKRRVEVDLVEAEKDGDLPRVLVLQGLRLDGELTAYIYHAPHSHCFEIRRFCWYFVFNPIDALLAIENGRAPRLSKDRYPDQTLEHDLGNRPLFVLKSQSNSLCEVFMNGIRDK
jgi:hypothetical protein